MSKQGLVAFFYDLEKGNEIHWFWFLRKLVESKEEKIYGNCMPYDSCEFTDSNVFVTLGIYLSGLGCMDYVKQ